MDCLSCGTPGTRVVKSMDEGPSVRRMRTCACGARFVSMEVPDRKTLRVTNGQPQPPMASKPPDLASKQPPMASDGQRGVGGDPPFWSDPVPFRTLSDLPLDRQQGVDRANTAPFRAAHRPIPLAVVTPPFLAIYNAYPRKDRKMPAAQVWHEIAADYPGGEAGLRDAIVAWFARGALKRHPYAGDHQHRPMLVTVLVERRWEDDQSAPDNEPSKAAPSAPTVPGCDGWHAGGKHNNRENPHGEQPGCPECKHIRARGGYDRPVRQGEPESAADVLRQGGQKR